MSGLTGLELTAMQGWAHGWAAEAARAASSGLVAAIWQGALLAGAATLGLRLMPKATAALRFAVWLGVFALVAALPLAGWMPHAGVGESGVGASGADLHRAWLMLDARWTLAIAAVWLAASLVRAATLVAAALRVRTLWRRARPVEFVSERRVGARRAQVCVSDDVDRPTVIGFFAPRILIPAWLMEKLTRAELEQVVLHEASHLGRADDWMNLLQKLALVVFPLNPALAWVERRLCFERELACDERVLAALAERKSAATEYASCLATLAEYRLERRGLVKGLALALGALGRESELGRRVKRILRPGAKMRPLQARLAMGGAVLGLLLAATELERCPQVIGFGAAGPEVALASGVNSQAGRVVGAGTGAGLAEYRAVALRVSAQTQGFGQGWKTVGDAAPQTVKARMVVEGARVGQAPKMIGAIPVQATEVVAGPRDGAVRVSDDVARGESAQPGMRMVAETQDGSREMQAGRREPQAAVGEFVVTRVVMTTWQGGSGFGVVRTSTEIRRVPEQSRSAESYTQGEVAQECTQSNVAQAQTQRETAAAQAMQGQGGGVARQGSAERVRAAAQEQGFRYAAVPVPGGWLVFQL